MSRVGFVCSTLSIMGRGLSFMVVGLWHVLFRWCKAARVLEIESGSTADDKLASASWRWMYSGYIYVL